MTTDQIAVRKNLYREIHKLDEEDVRKAASYVAFLRYIEEQEDAEDIADIEARRDEPTVSWEEVKARLDIKHGV